MKYLLWAATALLCCAQVYGMCYDGGFVSTGYSGCSVLDSKLYIDGYAIRDLTPAEIQEGKDYAVKMADYQKKVKEELAIPFAKRIAEIITPLPEPERPSFCAANSTVYFALPGCSVLGFLGTDRSLTGKILMSNVYIRDITSDEATKLYDYYQAHLQYQQAVQDAVAKLKSPMFVGWSPEELNSSVDMERPEVPRDICQCF